MAEEQTESGHISRSLALMWDYEAATGRGPKPSLTLPQIVERAVAIADAEGLDAVSMRRVATDLGVGTMSLYRYVPGKAELLDLMLERVAWVDTEPLPAGWRPALEQVADGLWVLYTSHPWLPFVDQTRPVMGPNALLGLELVLDALTDLPLADRDKMSLITAMDALAAGIARMRSNALLAEQRTGLSAEQFWEAQTPVLEGAMSSGRFPRMAALTEDAFAATEEDIYRFGVACLLDGLQARIITRPDAAG